MKSEKGGEQVRSIPLGELQVAADEARRTVDEKGLEELAASIREKGVIEALLVRPLAKGYEIVSGQRRWLAAQRAEMAFVPCVVREMADEHAAELRVVANLQREDLAPMEEAEAYGKLLERPGATIETVAAALAKAPSYVGRRVQLLKAIEPVREALKTQAIEVGHALELARLDETRQRKMLSRLECGVTLVEPNDVEDEGAEEGVCRFCGREEDNLAADGFEWANEECTICTRPACLEQFRVETDQQPPEWRKTTWSVADLRHQIEETSHVDLKDAPFPLIANLEPMPCTECPKRAGNALLLFDDCAQDTCTDRGCYHRKVNAWIEAELATAKAEKRPLLKLTANWSGVKDVVSTYEYSPSSARVVEKPGECTHGEEGIFVDGALAGRRATVCRNAKCEVHAGASASRTRSEKTRATKASKDAKYLATQQAARKALLERVKNEKFYRAALFEAIGHRKPGALVTGDGKVYRELAARVAGHVLGRLDQVRHGDLAAATGLDAKLLGWGSRDGLRKDLVARPVVQQMLFAAMALEAGALVVHEHDVAEGAKVLNLGMEELAELVDVDWKALRRLRANPEKRLTETPAKPAKQAARKTAKKIAPKKVVLSAAAKKRIAEAQKKRWAAAKKKKGGKR